MIFSPDLAAKITLGQKTVTRRPVKYENGEVVPCRYVAGRVYAVQLCRGGMAVDRIRVVSIARESLVEDWGWLSPPYSASALDEAHREGFDTPAAFVAKWLELYGCAPTGDVWRIEFEVSR